MKYYRPETVEKALKLLAEGVPLAGGTALAPERRSLEAVVDIDHLGFDHIRIEAGSIQIGAMTRLQRLLDPQLDLPVEFRRVCRLEAAWNLRNMATLGGTVMSADARSPLLVLLLALRARVSLSGQGSEITLDEILDQRELDEEPFLIEQITFNRPERLHYEYVARTPTDRPLVSAAAVAPSGGSAPTVAIGGYGGCPLRLGSLEGKSVQDVGEEAAELFLDAGDAFASAEYRAEIVAILVKRALEEVQS
jgi:CO/xanthine dehydrogenase FAD-binding subunit